MGRLQHSYLALQHNNTCLRTAANDHSALLSTLREQLVEKAGRVLQLEECLVDQERQLIALNHKTKVSHTLCHLAHLATLPTTLNPLHSAQALQSKHSELVECLGEMEAEREALSVSLRQCQAKCSDTNKTSEEQAREVTLLRQQLSAKEVQPLI